MRRVAVLLLSVFSLSLAPPALFLDASSNLPACCRRDGQHHCAMSMEQGSGPSGGASASALHSRCPAFPRGGALIPGSGAAVVAAAQPSHTPAGPESDLYARVALRCVHTPTRSHQKRGPPSLLS